MRQGKYYMKIRSVNHLCPAFVNPDFFQDSLAVRTVAVPAGIIVKFSMAAIKTPADVAAKSSGFAVYNGAGGFLLYIRQMLSGRTEILIRKVPYLLDLVITDGNHLPSNRTDCRCFWNDKKQDGYRSMWNSKIYVPSDA